MKHSVVVACVVLVLAGWGGAATIPVRYTLTFNTPEQMVGMDGVIRILTVAGTVGGIDVTGEYTEADWRVGPGLAPQTTLASGKLSCAKFLCTYSITTLLDQPVSVQGASFRLGHSVNGPLPGVTSRREWVSAVSRWAGNKVEPGVKDAIVSQAAGVQGASGQ